MKHLPIMTEDEIRYVCGIIPYRDVEDYFQHNPKEFAKICPGFRASGIAKLDVSNLLFRNRSRSFINYFIEKHIDDWLSQIQEHIDKCIGDGDSRIVALLKILPHSFFAGNVELYFKFVGEKYAEETLAVLGAGIEALKNSDSECECLQTSLNDRISAYSRIEMELNQVQNEQRKVNKKLNERVEEVKALKRVNAALEESNAAISTFEQTIVSLKLKVQEQEQCIQQLKSDLSSAKSEQLLLEREIREELAKQQEAEKYGQDTAQKPLRPKDLDEFRDFLGYNLENIEVPTNVDYFSLLKGHLGEILFQGIPIIISRSTGLSLMKCVSNALVGTPEISILSFSSEVTEKAIDNFLLQDKRLMCLDNFIGNCNETTLITICDKHRDKIIFLTVAYDHTLVYVPNELMRYCHYLNLNRIEAFIGNKELTEDPSVIEEEYVAPIVFTPDARWSPALKEMLEELGICGALSVHKSSLVTDESSLCQLLTFDVLPYCTDVLTITPFSVSERLVKYAGDSGRCHYKDLFGRWFT